MAVELGAVGWLQLLTQMRKPSGFLSRKFTVKPGGIYRGTKVAIDVERFGEEVAVAIKSFSGANLNDFDQFTTKEFTPPAYGEAFGLDIAELVNRMAGEDPHSAAYADSAGRITAKMAKGFSIVDDKINRAMEQQAAQIYQTGMLSLTNAAGDVVYEIDYKPKASHFPTVSVSWSDTANSTPLNDLEDLCGVIRTDGKVDCDDVYMGKQALRNLINNENLGDALDNRGIDIGAIRPEMSDSGATFYGFLWVGTYRLFLWAYDDEFTLNGSVNKYLDPNKVIVTSTKTRLDKTSARVDSSFWCRSKS